MDHHHRNEKIKEYGDDCPNASEFYELANFSNLKTPPARRAVSTCFFVQFGGAAESQNELLPLENDFPYAAELPASLLDALREPLFADLSPLSTVDVSG